MWGLTPARFKVIFPVGMSWRSRPKRSISHTRRQSALLRVSQHPLELVTADDVLVRHPEEIRLQRTPELLELAEFDFTVLRPTGIGGLF